MMDNIKEVPVARHMTPLRKDNDPVVLEMDRYMNRPHVLDKQIAFKKKRLALSKNDSYQINGISYAETPVMHSRRGSALEDAAVRNADKELEIMKLEQEKAEILARIDTALDAFGYENEAAMEVLERWYFFLQPIDEIAGEMGYTHAWVYALRKKGLLLMHDLLARQTPAR